MKVDIICDALINKGGVERIVLRQQQLFDAHIYTLRYDKGNTFPEFRNVHVISDKRGILSSMMSFSRLKLSPSHRFILHGGYSLYAARNNKPSLWYCHAPSRSLYDLFDTDMNPSRGVMREMKRIPRNMLIMLDKSNVRHVTKVVANSLRTQWNCYNVYGITPQVVYPYVDLDLFKPISKGDYYFSHARLDRIKRIDKAIELFKGTDEKLVIASSGSEEVNLRRAAYGHNNIIFLGRLDDDTLMQWLGKAKATIFLSYREDFGMVAVESLACGKPVICSSEGGYNETVLHRGTGYHLVGDIHDAFDFINRNYDEMSERCRQHAQRFSLARFDAETINAVRGLG